MRVPSHAFALSPFNCVKRRGFVGDVVTERTYLSSAIDRDALQHHDPLATILRVTLGDRSVCTRYDQSPTCQDPLSARRFVGKL